MIVNSYGMDYEVKVRLEVYLHTNSIAVALDYFDTEFQAFLPFANLTTCFGEKVADGMAYIDTNNYPWALDFIAEYDLGKPVMMGDMPCMGYSGYCAYPLYEFNMAKLEELDPEGFKRFMEGK